MSETFKLTGMKELEQALAQIGEVGKRRRVGLKALRAGGEPIARAARAIVPVDRGHLRESIDVSTSLAPSQRGDRGAVASLEIHVGPGQHPQAITQEFGTYKEPAQPFMRPAWEAERMTALDLIGATLGIEVAKQAAKAPKVR
ncbi:phage protein, HK97 gp10 family [Sphingobium herbicidovorans NBRC 16415]|uniref:Phage protein, HK97 gp10 family n=1 Tax=Sphingobium herbicidovorans (strain ATCC 700291 / DSM 11019 / CCUG 56400 / KCTC 2939 / LMG 18315 / NBRC 16415 / MH) TaxID=1219045 RepID=A0A086PBG7_SPHHM|nr:HK97-gp10 family putative phage morphogenesis protein [Sphingobium herbicidovorans]KFG90735.1 phage protein, HK97 gp10 family [Sphingobium herbicidovorans NBRC 16415]